jgi:Holliday junction resolvase RusA-like endonuclease
VITVALDIEPRGKGRPRFGNGRTFTDAKTVAYETALKFAAMAAMSGRPKMEGALHVHVTANMPIPASWSNGKQQMALQGTVRPTSKPDGDNILKAATDALNKVVWNDDAQIVEATIVKQYAARPSLVIVARPA